jgi:polyisoprenoid-binding protein YceI
MNKKIMLLSLLALVLAVAAPALSAGKLDTTRPNWKLDNAHSRVKFSVTHLLVSEVEGSFKSFNASLSSEKSDFSDAAVEFTIDAKSINTENEMRDKHLQSDDFFNAEKYPAITFKSTSWKKTGDKTFALEGDLTIRDVTKRVTFDVTYGGTVKDPWGNTKAGFKATTVIDRFDYNLKWNKLTEAGAVVSKDVAVTLNLEFAQEQK